MATKTNDVNKKRQNMIKKIDALEPIKSTDSKEIIVEKLKKTNDALKNLMTFDAFTNSMARIGYGQPNLTEGADYPMKRFSYNYQLFNSMYRGSWLVRKIVDTMPSDMLKNWIKFKTELEPDSIKKVEKTIRYTKTKSKIKNAMQWGRLYGGAAALIMIDGQDDELEQPLDYDKIVPDSYKGLLVFDRWSGIYPSIELITDINNPDFGLPEFYNINTANLNNGVIDTKKAMKVHNSRIIRFQGRELPYWEKIQEMQWGESEIEIVYEELKKRDNTSANIASLIFLANIRVLKMNDLGQLLGAGTEKSQSNLYNTLEAQNQIMSNMGMYVMDKDDSYENHQYSFGGLDEIYNSFMLDVAGACEMPVSKLFGRNPSGFNATGEGDLKQYYDTLTEKQESYLSPILDKLIPVIFMSTLGKIPDDLDWEFNPVFQIDNKDLSDLAKSYSDQIIETFNAGLISKAIALKELKQQSELTGMWTNITDKYIEMIEKKELEEENVLDEEEEKQLSDELKNDNGNLNEEQKDVSEGQSEPQKDGWKTKMTESINKAKNK